MDFYVTHDVPLAAIITFSLALFLTFRTIGNSHAKDGALVEIGLQRI